MNGTDLWCESGEIGSDSASTGEGFHVEVLGQGDVQIRESWQSGEPCKWFS